MTIRMILATDDLYGIGKEGELPWQIKEDLQYFREQTSHSTVIMGCKTFDSLGRKDGLPNRFNIVVSNSWEYESSNVQTTSLEHLISHTGLYNTVDEDIWVIGGATIYKQLLPYVDEIHHTMVDGVYDCDTFFDLSFLEDWYFCGMKTLSDKASVNVWKRDIS